MSIAKVALENIGVFRGKREFSLSNGLNLVYAPNASGKTSLIAGLKAVSISALASQELARILNDYEDIGRVRLVLNNTEYSVELVRKPDGRIETRGKTLAENGVIRKIAFIDLENELVSSIYTGDSDRVKAVLHEVTGVSSIKTTIEVLEGLLSESQYRYEIEKRSYEARKGEVERRIRELNERLEKIRQRITEIRSDPTFEPARREVERIESEREKHEERLKEVGNELLEKRNTYGLLATELKNLEADIKTFQNRWNELETERLNLERNIMEIRRRIETLQEEVRSLEEKISEISRDIREKKGTIDRRKQVMGYALCPCCGNPIDREKLQNEVMRLEEEIASLVEERENLERSKQKYEIEISELKERGEDRLRNIEKEQKDLDRRIKELEKRYSGVKNEIDRISEQIERLENLRKELELEIARLEARLDNFRDKIPLVDELRKLWEDERRLIDEIEGERARLKQIDMLYKEVKRLEETIEALKLLKEYFEIRLNELKVAVVNKVNEAILRHFKLLNLAELEYPVIADDLSLTLTRKGGIATTLAELSDAEKAIFTILLTLALKDYVAESFPFYAVDSLIEFIDDTRAKEILKYLMETAGNRIVIVTKTKPYAGEPGLLSQEGVFLNTIPFE